MSTITATRKRHSHACKIFCVRPAEKLGNNNGTMLPLERWVLRHVFFKIFMGPILRAAVLLFFVPCNIPFLCTFISFLVFRDPLNLPVIP